MKVIVALINSKPDELERVEELILMRSELQVIDVGYQELKLPTPEWVIDKLTAVNREIALRVQGELERRLKAAKARRAALRTADEKRRDLDSEIAELEGMLN